VVKYFETQHVNDHNLYHFRTILSKFDFFYWGKGKIIIMIT
jgi:hypothetical protein